MIKRRQHADGCGAVFKYSCSGVQQKLNTPVGQYCDFADNEGDYAVDYPSDI